MPDPIQLAAIEVEVSGDQVAIPRGMNPIHLHEYALGGRKWIAHVVGWTAQGEYEQNFFDVYLLSEAQQFMLTVQMDGGETKQKWYSSFKPPTGHITKEASRWVTVQE